MKPAVDFRARVEELRMLGSARPRRGDREIVMAALGSKWEGLQSVAAQTLGRWGDRESVEALRDLWLRCQGRKNASSLQGVVARSLASCVGAQDAEWVLDCYFDSFKTSHSYLGIVVGTLPFETTRKRLLEESHSPQRNRRHAALVVLGRLPVSERRALLKRFLDDEDGDIRAIAYHLDSPFLPGEK
jgi:HEAT repeat protein